MRLRQATLLVSAAIAGFALLTAGSAAANPVGHAVSTSVHMGNGCPLPRLGMDGKPLPPPVGPNGRPLPPPIGADGKPCPPPLGPDGKPLPPPPGFH